MYCLNVPVAARMLFVLVGFSFYADRAYSSGAMDKFFAYPNLNNTEGIIVFEQKDSGGPSSKRFRLIWSKGDLLEEILALPPEDPATEIQDPLEAYGRYQGTNWAFKAPGLDFEVPPGPKANLPKDYLSTLSPPEATLQMLLGRGFALGELETMKRINEQVFEAKYDLVAPISCILTETANMGYAVEFELKVKSGQINYLREFSLLPFGDAKFIPGFLKCSLNRNGTNQVLTDLRVVFVTNRLGSNLVSPWIRYKPAKLRMRVEDKFYALNPTNNSRTRILTATEHFLPQLAEDSNHVATLYQQFLKGETSQGYISFYRETFRPGSRASTDTNTTGSSNVAELLASAPRVYTEYGAFWWNGSNFLHAAAMKGPVGVEAGFLTALWIEGFDGDGYWHYQMTVPASDFAAKLVTNASGAVVTSQPPGNRGRLLSYFSAAEVEAARAKGAVTPQVRSIEEWFAYCRRIVQFGLDSPLEGAPQISGSNILARAATTSGDSEKLVLEIVGTAAHPESLKYSGTVLYRVIPDYSGDCIIVDRLSQLGSLPSLRDRFHILESAAYAPPKASRIYAGSTYEAGIPDIKSLMDEAKAAGGH